MMLRRLLKHRGLGMNLIAGFSFLMLAVYGWGLGWEELSDYLLVILICLVGLIGFAALLGWLLRKWMGRGENAYPATKADAADDIKNQDKKHDNNSQEVKRD